MKHSIFSIGCHFYTAAGKWRCTDVGTRTIVAIKIDEGEITTLDTVTGKMSTKKTDYKGDDYSWLAGPPYAVAEFVFDEFDQEVCSFVDVRENDDER